MNPSTVNQRLYWLSRAEGITSLLLFMPAMPLKYLADWPWGVKIIGPIHGFAFVAFIIQVIMLSLEQRWTIKRIALSLILGVLPAGTLLGEKQILGIKPV